MVEKLMSAEIGKYINNKQGYKSFALNPFPSKELLSLREDLTIKLVHAQQLLGKLDGIAHMLPDVECFIRMYELKDATASAQIEGTQSTLINAIEEETYPAALPTDARDITLYIAALHYGIQRLHDLPLSLRFIREIHGKLMTDARVSHFTDPGHFRKTQNWVGGANLNNAIYVPPNIEDMMSALNHFETFLHRPCLSLLKIGIAHAQFEAIHPFLDGNGRVGRILIALLLLKENILERPVLFLSSFFKKHQQLYYQNLSAYHSGETDAWMHFFLDGIEETAKQSIDLCKNIRLLRDSDMEKIQQLSKREATSSMKILRHLFAVPLVTTKDITTITGYTHAGAQRAIDRMIKLKILTEFGAPKPQNENKKYKRKSYIYRRYVDLFI